MYSRMLYLAFRNLFVHFQTSDEDLSIQMICRPSLGYVEIPQRAESRQQEFGYISEDDGLVHFARTIDWDNILQ